MQKYTTGINRYAHLLSAPRAALDAMTRGEVLAMPGISAFLADNRLTNDEALALAKKICAANEWRLGKQ